MIEREMPGAGDFTDQEMRAISGRSCQVLSEMPQVQWLEGFVTADKIYCVMIAPDESVAREHADRAGFPANSISQIRRIVDPTTAEEVPVES
jgi:hypothetical protein